MLIEPAELSCSLDRNRPLSHFPVMYLSPKHLRVSGGNPGLCASSLCRKLAPYKKACFVQRRAGFSFSLVEGLQSSPFNLDRTLLAVFLMSAVRSSSSCLVSEGRGKMGEKSGWAPRPFPAPSHSRPAAALTLIWVGGSQDGTMLFLHLLHVFRQFLNAAPDLFHLRQKVGHSQPSCWARQENPGETAGLRERGQPQRVD